MIMTWQEIVAKKLARLVFWVFKNFGTRTGYTKLIAILIISCIIGIVADIAGDRGIIAELPVPLMIIFAIWILDMSYRKKRPPIDAFVMSLLTSIWIMDALVSIVGAGIFLLWLQFIWVLTCTNCGILWLLVLRRSPHAKEFNLQEFWPE